MSVEVIPPPFPGTDFPGMRIVEITDNNMESKFRFGDFVVVDCNDLRLYEGYCLFDFWGAAVVYRVQFAGGGKVTLSNDMPRGIPSVCPIEKAEAGLLGRVIGAMVKV